jgi:tetratricopeptide (TPR) repeat protein
MGDLEASMANHERAISLDPEDGWAYMERGYTRRDLGQDIEGALTDFNQAIRLNPFSPDALLARALLYGWDLGEHDPAFADLERCHEVDPNYYWCFFDEAQLRDDLGDTDAAVANFERYLELVPEFDCPDCQEDARNYIRQYG